MVGQQTEEVVDLTVRMRDLCNHDGYDDEEIFEDVDEVIEEVEVIRKGFLLLGARWTCPY